MGWGMGVGIGDGLGYGAWVKVGMSLKFGNKEFVLIPFVRKFINA